MCRACSTQVEMRNTYRGLVVKSEGKKPLRRPRRTWEDNIKSDLRETASSGMGSIHLAQNRD
jgi:hypothetical protein